MAKVREFETGATRDTDNGKPDYEGFLSPLVLEAYANHMNKHRVQPDGNIRASDNWQLGIPLNEYLKSLWRHFMDVWKLHRGLTAREGMEEALCACMFNVMGYLHEYLKAKKDAVNYKAMAHTNRVSAMFPLYNEDEVLMIRQGEKALYETKTSNPNYGEIPKG